MSSKKSNYSQQGTGAATRHIAGSLRPHPIFKESTENQTQKDGSDGYRCEHGRQWCPGPQGLKYGILPCLDCRRDADADLLEAYEEADQQGVATPRPDSNRGGQA